MTELAFVDSETTGLDSDRHEMWELAVIVAEHSPGVGVVNADEWAWQLPVDLTLADPTALRFSNFYKRRSEMSGWGRAASVTRVKYPLDTEWTKAHIADVAEQIAKLLDGRHFVGAVPDFDARFLTRFLRKHEQAPTWHYHLVDVENLAVGWLAGNSSPIAPPWDSDELAKRIGVHTEGRHQALVDARWAKAIYEKVYAS